MKLKKKKKRNVSIKKSLEGKEEIWVVSWRSFWFTEYGGRYCYEYEGKLREKFIKVSILVKMIK